MKIFKLLFLALTSVVTSVDDGSDYYGKFGVEKTATTKEIRKAFKKLALTMHPDKSREPDAHETFMELNKIYEVLKDDELRKKYDRWGEKGLEDNSKGGRYESWDFFHEEFGLYDDDDHIHVLDAVEVQNAMASDDVWMIKFYSERCSHCHDMAPSWKEAASQLDRIVKFGAISCRDYRRTCMNLGITGYPTVMIFDQGAQRFQLYQGGKFIRRGKKFPGSKTTENLVDAGLKSVPNRVRILHSLISLPNYIKKPVIYILSDADGEFNYPKIQFEYQLSVGFGMDAYALKIDCTKDILTELCKAKTTPEETMFVCPPGIDPTINLHQHFELNTFDAKEVIPTVLDLIQLQTIDTTEQLNLLISQKKLIALDFGTFSVEQKMLLKRLPSYLVRNDRLLGSDKPFWIANCKLSTLRAACQSIFGGKSNLIVFTGRGKGAFEVFHDPWSLMNINDFVKTVLTHQMYSPTPQTLPGLMVDGSDWILDFSAPWCPPCNNFLPHVRYASNKLAEKGVKIAYVDCEAFPSICNSYNIRNYPTLKYIGKNHLGDQVRVNYNGDYSWEALVDFYEDIKNPSYTKLTAATWQSEVIDRDDGVIWFIDFAAHWCGPCQRMFPDFKKVAKMLAGTIRFGHVECPDNKELCDSLRINSYPTLKFTPPKLPGRKTPSVQTYNYNQRNAYSFIHYLSSELNRFSTIGSPAGVPVNLFIKQMFEKDKLVLVDFYANWCKPCKQFEPYFHLASIKYKETIQFIKVDCASNPQSCRGFQLQAYPTLLFFQPGKQQRVIEMDFDVSHIHNQLDKYVSKKNTASIKDEL